MDGFLNDPNLMISENIPHCVNIARKFPSSDFETVPGPVQGRVVHSCKKIWGRTTARVSTAEARSSLPHQRSRARVTVQKIRSTMVKARKNVIRNTGRLPSRLSVDAAHVVRCKHIVDTASGHQIFRSRHHFSRMRLRPFPGKLRSRQ